MEGRKIKQEELDGKLADLVVDFFAWKKHHLTLM